MVLTFILSLPQTIWFKLLEFPLCIFIYFLFYRYSEFIDEKETYHSFCIVSTFGLIILNTAVIVNYLSSNFYVHIDLVYTSVNLVLNSGALITLIKVWNSDKYVKGESHLLFLLVHLQLTIILLTEFVILIIIR